MKLLPAAPRDTGSVRRRMGFALIVLAASLVVLWAGDGAASPGVDLELDDIESMDSSGALAKMGIVLALMIAVGLPLFVIIGLLGVMCFAWLDPAFDGLNTLDEFPAQSASMLGKEVLLAIPFFVASGAIMSEGGIAPRLVNFARALVGWLPGGLAIACVGSCVFFAAISGSSPVTVIAIGSMMYPQLLKAGYDKRFTLGLVSSGGSLGILIPPSIPMLVYAIVAGGQQPIDASELFMAGILPGLLIGVLMSAYAMYKAGSKTREPFEMKVVVQRGREGFWAISLPLVILGGIYTGVFTPTEAAAVSVVYAMVVEFFIHRDIQFRDLPKILGDAALTMGAILIIMLMAVTLNHFLVDAKIPDQIVAKILEMELTPVTFLLIVNIFLLGVGALMDSISAILIIVPLLAPVAIQLGIDPVHLGVVFIVNLEIGYLTPPIGINLFVASLAFKESIGEVVRGVVPFILLMMIGLGVVTYVPTVSMGLVNKFMRDKDFYEPFPEMPEAKPIIDPEDLADDDDDDDDDDDGDDGDTAEQPSGAEGERVLSIEEMMKQSEEPDEDDEDEDEDEAKVPDGPARVLSIEEMMEQADKDED